MTTPGLIKAFTVAAALGARLLVKPTATAGQVAAAVASTDAIIGVSGRLPGAVGEHVDVILGGIAEVVYGGTIAAGDLLTSDASGRAIAAAPGAGVNARVAGIALVAGVVGDIGTILLSPGRIQG